MTTFADLVRDLVRRLRRSSACRFVPRRPASNVSRPVLRASAAPEWKASRRPPWRAGAPSAAGRNLYRASPSTWGLDAGNAPPIPLTPAEAPRRPPRSPAASPEPLKLFSD